MGGSAQKRLPGDAGIDRDHPLALGLEVFHDEKARPVPIGAGADQRDRADPPQDAGEVFVVISVMVHRPHHTGGRFARNASMPSAASAASMFRVMTSPA